MFQGKQSGTSRIRWSYRFNRKAKKRALMNETWWVNESDLDDDQKRVIALGPDGRHLITGPPGSGKTNMLILRANYLSASGRPNLLILVFTRTLREFLVSGASRYSFPRDKVQTYN